MLLYNVLGAAKVTLRGGSVRRASPQSEFRGVDDADGRVGVGCPLVIL